MNATPGSTESLFRRDVARSLACLRSGLSELIAAIPSEVRKGADLHRALHIDRKLSWQVYKVTSVTDPMTAGLHVPSPTNLRSFFRAAAKQGVPQSLIDVASQAANDFEEVITVHAGDRATFDSMVSSLGSDETAEQLDLVNRRLTFRGQRHTLGIQAKTKLKLNVMQPSSDPSRLDMVRVEGFIALRQLRQTAPLILSHSGGHRDDGKRLQGNREPLEPQSDDPEGLALMPRFCSDPLPEFRSTPLQNGTVQGEIVSRDVGMRAAVTCMEGHIIRDWVSRYSTAADSCGASLIKIRTPCEVAIIDVMVREDTFGPLSPTVMVRSDHMCEVYGQGLIDRNTTLPAHHTVTYLGKGPMVLNTPDVPRYAQMGEYIFERTGWDAERFDVYRCRIEYPVMPSSIMIRFDLPQAPK